MLKKISLSFLVLSTLLATTILLIALNVHPSKAGGCCGGGCGGNMTIAPWGPANYQERPIYPLRGCGSTGCVKGWRSAIITPPPTCPYGGQVVASPPIGCAPTPPCGCGAPASPGMAGYPGFMGLR